MIPSSNPEGSQLCAAGAFGLGSEDREWAEERDCHRHKDTHKL